ncbi:unnamed protein product [Miscanthus lutarioriparius]|uniref:Uncharacterized protein n=1 Tax=Miscanthus lutarioriparius TaxID=422564 RepID=A0A811QR78_9POAL|nr:unnamed protein product [Miscanthus lutarioriparius]
MASSSKTEAASSAPSLDAFRDGTSNLPLVDCSKCGAQLIGLVSKQDKSFGQKFYKCPLINHFYMWEDQYVEYLIGKSKLPRCFSKIGRGSPSLGLTQAMDPRMSSQELIQAMESLKESIGGCTTMLESTTASMKDAHAALKKIVDANQSIGSNIDKIGDRLLVLGLAIMFIVVLLLLVALVK